MLSASLSGCLGRRGPWTGEHSEPWATEKKRWLQGRGAVNYANDSLCFSDWELSSFTGGLVT